MTSILTAMASPTHPQLPREWKRKSKAGRMEAGGKCAVSLSCRHYVAVVLVVLQAKAKALAEEDDARWKQKAVAGGQSKRQKQKAEAKGRMESRLEV